MGVSLSTIGGWSIILSIAGWYAFQYWTASQKREAARIAAQRQRAEERQNLQARKENRAKKQRVEAYSKDFEDSDKAAKSKSRPAKSPASQQGPVGDYSTDDGLDNREFARQLAGVKQGTSFVSTKKTEEKKQRSVKQSRAQELSDNADDGRVVSAPSSTAGADADDDQSPIASPEFGAVDAGDISDMLERPAPGPAILRLTDTHKDEPKEKKVKPTESAETKKQRQNKKKAEAAKAAREEAEKERKVKMEAQRRLARISEGRAAKDGSQFVTSHAPSTSAWSGSKTNGGSAAKSDDGDFLPVQPLDTFEPSSKVGASKPAAPAGFEQTDSWMSSLPSEEEQLEMLRSEEAWSTVKQKKPLKTKKKETSGSNEEPEANLATKPQQLAPTTLEPVVTKAQTTRPNGRPTPSIAQHSSFAALSSNDSGPQEEEEWDV